MTGSPSASPAPTSASPPIFRWPRAAFAKDARAIAPNGKIWTKGDVGQALAGRGLLAICASSASAAAARRLSANRTAPASFSALDTELQALLRQSAAKG